MKQEAKQMRAKKYFISCEGETEWWYFEWLQQQINARVSPSNKIEFIHKKVSPSSFAKSNSGTFTKDMIKGSSFCRIEDIEDYSDIHINKLHQLFKSCKEAMKIQRNYLFYIGYSNLTFETWIIAHKMQVPAIADRKNYYKIINYAFGTKFKNNAEYKHEQNFKSILSSLSLDDVIYKALPECERFKNNNKQNSSDLRREYAGFSYYLANPDTTLDDYVRMVLKDSALI
jgi:hypothetical protein